MAGDDDTALADVQNGVLDAKEVTRDEVSPPKISDVAPVVASEPTPAASPKPPPPPPPQATTTPTQPSDPPDANVRPLNVTDALGYLDCVKQQFADQSDVYNRFLDIMKDFKSQFIDTPGVIERVSTLFRGYPMLIQGFNTFLPAGYRIECTTDIDNSDLITVTTPMGTTTQAMRDLFPSTRDAIPTDVAMAPPQDGEAEADIDRALLYVQRVKNRYANDPEKYKAFLEFLSPRELAGENVLHKVQRLFKDDSDLIQGFYHFLPDKSVQQRMVARLDEMEDGPTFHAEHKHRGKKQEGASNTPLSKTHPSVPQKRKRKPADRDKGEADKEKHKEVAPKAGPSKRTKQQHAPSEAPSPSLAHLHAISPSPLRSLALPHNQLPQQHSHGQGHAPSSASHHSQSSSHRHDDTQLFDRVKRALRSEETYNEFLKLVNLFTQDIIDTARLVREARTYLGEGELMTQFREILGWDDRRERYAGAEDVWSRPIGVLDRPTRNQLNLRYGSYRKLPASETSVVCSGRDDMCRSVLNDEWVSQPTFATEDAGFMAHKKNAYEEALHRSEEERHEYDFHIEAIHRTIQALEPYNNKINQLSPEEKTNYKFKPSLQGATKSIHLRVIKKVYGREAGVEVFQAMQDIPVIAIPLVLQRLKQKHDEWKRAQREWNKVWKEVDARNYYKSLDHQGITFKTAEKKTLTSKAFVSQIEATRDEQMSSRAALIDPLINRTRPRHQLEYVMDDPDVLQDCLKLVCSFVDRTQGQINLADRKKIETFLCSFVPLFFMLDSPTPNSSLGPKTDNASNEAVDPEGMVVDDLDSSTSRGGRSTKNGAGDLRKRLLKSEQAKSSRRTRAQDAISPTSSKPASPILADVTLPDMDPQPTINGHSVSAPSSPTESRSTRKGTFFTNTHFYILFRMLEVLYSRLKLFKDRTASMADDPVEPLKSNPLAEHLGALVDLSGLGDRAKVASHFYNLLLESCEKLFDNEIEQHVFEDQLRYMFGIQHAYKMFTVDKVIGSIVKQVQHILADPKSQELFEVLRRERGLARPTPQDLVNLRRATEKVIGPDENLFRMIWLLDSSTVTIQLLGKDDSDDDDTEVQTGRWEAYVQSYASPNETPGSTLSPSRLPFLKRTLRETLDVDVKGDDSSLAMRICVRTYRLFYLPHTEEIFWRRSSSDDLAEASRRLTAHNARKKAWLDKFSTREPTPVAKAESPSSTAKSS
ncbi:hypothetical protein PHLGIDRAFT_27677 [Phlebiopsis gigantea 11061_1 CR5-6]|uniref:Histone deacetylase interacting domain-containing protein n=1 Tax=Phlebiopsis gigantea (strain 11061_1 CR5-6) TaxID=745531 RepID=A0A0C3S6I3_PHLG1|nr:hypothetical protein PHLGIDRAFT_27677 [Phlebiopsis gigantea 11061_1 CR5-6]